jgi:hypothetical protein
MTGVEFGARAAAAADPVPPAMSPRIAGRSVPVSSPLRRAAGRLQATLPPGWRVDVVEDPHRPGGESAPVLRVTIAEN